MAGGHRACAARSVLDGSERGARLEQDGPHREDAEGAGLNDTTLMQQALGLPPPWTVVGAHFDADYRRRMKSAGCVSPTRTQLGTICSRILVWCPTFPITYCPRPGGMGRNEVEG